MKDNQSEKLPVTAETAEAENKCAATELGKFKDVKALMEAYNALEAEFTRRSQRLRELEANQELEANKEQSAPADAVNAEVPSPEAHTVTDARPVLTEEMKNAVIEEYLNGVRASRGVPIISGGGAVTAVRRTPNNIREAGALAKKLFENKEER